MKGIARHNILRGEMRLETRAVHSGRAPRGRGDQEGGRPHATPIDLSTTYGFERTSVVASSLDRLIEGEDDVPNRVYGRLSNPNGTRLEHAVAALEGAEDAVAFASGMAAITAAVMASRSAGVGADENIVAIRPTYGGTDHLFSSGLLGPRVRWVEEAEVDVAIDESTLMVFAETPANPTLHLVDIAAVARAARSASNRIGRLVPVAIDSTFATPVLQQPLPLGADLVIHSATKFIGGHGDAMGGIVATSREWSRRLRQVRIATGGLMHPMAAYLLHRGLQTLPVRVRAQEAGARELAARLGGHPAVRRVYFPGVDDDARSRRLLATQQSGPGSVLSFCIDGGAHAAARMVEALRLITPAVSLGSVDSLIQAPALLTHRIVDAEDRQRIGIPDDLLRLSVGLESPEDLWEDVERGLTAARMSAA
ncbi:MAG: PLP-dependent aspartate aminotransferase family protein [Gemmatimonadota bacterium]